MSLHNSEDTFLWKNPCSGWELLGRSGMVRPWEQVEMVENLVRVDYGLYAANCLNETVPHRPLHAADRYKSSQKSRVSLYLLFSLNI